MGLTKPKSHNLDTSVFKIDDPIVDINNGLGNNPNNTDIGFIFERGTTGDNVAILWDKTALEFVLVTTTATGDSVGDLTYTGYANLQVNDITCNSITPSNGASGTFTTADNKTVTVTNGIITSIV